ncbi:M15 family metallopeptidase [Propionibacteriaceae bacterium Y1923]
MKLFKKARTVALVATLSAGLVAGTASIADAYTRSQYPAAVMTWVRTPSGWDDAARVKVSGSSITCNVPTKAATAGAATAHVRSELQPLVQELMRRTVAMGYTLRKADTGAYNCRFIGGTRTPSNHAYGRAIDINWQSNPQSTVFKSDIPPAVVKMWINHGFYWGGHYTSPTKYDTMHFEFMGSYSSINTYYNRLTGSTTPPPSNVATLAVGSTGARVTTLQKTMNTWFPSYADTPLATDGIFGTKTENAVKEFQRRTGLTVDGRFGPATRAKFQQVTGVLV